MARTSTADLLLHPVRLRIVQALLGGRNLTTAQLADELDDVSTATLYRQIATLADANILEVVAERRVRGAVERTFALSTANTVISDDALATMTPADHKRGFVAFIGGILATFDRYIDRGDADLRRDLVSYRQTALELSDEETLEFLGRLRELHAEYSNRPAASHRTRRVLSTILVPTDPSPRDRSQT